VVVGYSWMPAHTIIDKIELRAVEHRDSSRPSGTLFVRNRRLSARLLGSNVGFNAAQFTNAIAVCKIEKYSVIIVRAQEAFLKEDGIPRDLIAELTRG